MCDKVTASASRPGQMEQPGYAYTTAGCFGRGASSHVPRKESEKMMERSHFFWETRSSWASGILENIWSSGPSRAALTCVCTVCVCGWVYRKCVLMPSLSLLFKKRMTCENVWEKKSVWGHFMGFGGIFFFSPLISIPETKPKTSCLLHPSLSFPPLSLFLISSPTAKLFFLWGFSSQTTPPLTTSISGLFLLFPPSFNLLSSCCSFLTLRMLEKMNQRKQQHQPRSTTRSRQTKTCGKRSSRKYGWHAVAVYLLIKSIFM